MSPRRRASARVRDRTDEEVGRVLDEDAVAQLEALYASLPSLTCKGLCAHSCSRHVDASDVERARIAAAGVDLDSPTTDGACPALSRALVTTGVCTVHPIRPMVCRLWGAAASMPCPHGCTPTGGVLDDAAAMGLLAASLEAGGHRDTGVRELLTACMTDPQAAALMGLFVPEVGRRLGGAGAGGGVRGGGRGP